MHTRAGNAARALYYYYLIKYIINEILLSYQEFRRENERAVSRVSPQVISKSKQYRSKVSTHSLREKKKGGKGSAVRRRKGGQVRKGDEIYFLNYKDATMEEGGGGQRVYHERTADTCVKEGGWESLENFSRSNTTSSRSQVLLHYGATSSPPVCFCDISGARLPFSLSHPRPRNFAVEKSHLDPTVGLLAVARRGAARRAAR